MEEKPAAPEGRRVSLTKAQRSSEVGAELLSLCQTVTADGSLSDIEVAALRDWLASNSASDLPAIQFLLPIVERILVDGVVTVDERRELFLAIEKVLPQDVREMSRTARRLREQSERAEQRLTAAAAKLQAQERRARNQPIEHFDFMIAGAKYEGRPAVIERHVRVPDGVHLVRDKSNRYSRNAVRVLTTSGHEIGYVPEEDATELAPLLDADHPYVARVKKILTGSTHAIPVVIADLYGHGAEVPGHSQYSVAGSAPSSPRRQGSSAAKFIAVAIALLLLIVVFRSCGQ